MKEAERKLLDIFIGQYQLISKRGRNIFQMTTKKGKFVHLQALKILTHIVPLTCVNLVAQQIDLG